MQEVAKTEKGAVTNPGAIAPPRPHMGAQDLLIPKILCLHSMSKKAKDKNNDAEPGEFRDTVDNKLFGSTEHPFDFIPLHMLHFWVERDISGGGQGKYAGQVPVTGENENWPRQFTRDGRLHDRVKTMEAFVVLPEDIKSGNDFPYVLSFRMTSARAGKALMTQMYVRNAQAGKAVYETVCQLGATEEGNDKGDFFVQHVKPIRAVTAAEKARAEYWIKLILSGAAKKDDSDITEGEEAGDAAMKDTKTTKF